MKKITHLYAILPRVKPVKTKTANLKLLSYTPQISLPPEKREAKRQPSQNSITLTEFNAVSERAEARSSSMGRLAESDEDTVR